MLKAIAGLGEYLAPVFAKVADPFPEDMRKNDRSVSPANARRMQELRNAGYTLQGIAKTCGVSDETARKYTVTPQKQQVAEKSHLALTATPTAPPRRHCRAGRGRCQTANRTGRRRRPQTTHTPGLHADVRLRLLTEAAGQGAGARRTA